MNLVISKCVTAVKVSNFSGHYLRNRSTLDIGVLGYIGVVQHKEHSPEVLSIPPGTPCIRGLNDCNERKTKERHQITNMESTNDSSHDGSCTSCHYRSRKYEISGRLILVGQSAERTSKTEPSAKSKLIHRYKSCCTEGLWSWSTSVAVPSISLQAGRASVPDSCPSPQRDVRNATPSLIKRNACRPLASKLTNGKNHLISLCGDELSALYIRSSLSSWSARWYCALLHVYTEHVHNCKNGYTY